MRKKMTDRGVAALRPRAKLYAVSDPELTGLWIRIYPTGGKSFVAIVRDPERKQKWVKIGRTDAMTIDQAREQAREVLRRARAGLPAFEPKAESVGAIVENWRKRHVQANRLISAPEINRLLDTHILPAWRDRELIAIRRSDIAALLDKIEDGHGKHAADACLTVVRSVMSWYAVRHDAYAPVVIKGMRRRLPHTIARARILSDDELRGIWQAAESSGVFGALVRMCLLTAQRSRKVAGMKWSDIENGAWTVPCGPREKSTGGTLVLPPLALAIIEAQPRLATNPHVLAGRGAGPSRAWSAGKRAIDAKLPPGVPQWQLHDLRRTARSLMSRAGVSSDIGERCLGHAIPGIRGIYDKHSFKDEKAEALAKLATLIESIVHPRANVVPLPLRARSQ